LFRARIKRNPNQSSGQINPRCVPESNPKSIPREYPRRRAPRVPPRVLPRAACRGLCAPCGDHRRLTVCAAGERAKGPRRCNGGFRSRATNGRGPSPTPTPIGPHRTRPVSLGTKPQRKRCAQRLRPPSAAQGGSIPSIHRSLELWHYLRASCSWPGSTRTRMGRHEAEACRSVLSARQLALPVTQLQFAISTYPLPESKRRDADTAAA
jgi:hypothetical protein